MPNKQFSIIINILVLCWCISVVHVQDVDESSIDEYDNYPLEDYDELYHIDGEDDVEGFEMYLNGSDSLYGFEDYINVNLEPPQKPVDTAIIVFYIIITVVGLIANAVVFFVIFAGNEIGKTVTAIYILQLTIADTIFLFTLPIFSMQKVTHNWSFGSGVCTLCQTIKFMNYYAGIFFLMAMSVDRYVAVAYSTRLSKIRTKRRTYIICLSMWCLSIVMSLPLMLYARTEEVLDVNLCRVIFPGYTEFNENISSFEIIKEDYVTTTTEDTNDTLYGSGVTYVIDEDAWGNEMEFKCDHSSHSWQYKSWLIADFIVGFVIPFLVIVVSYFKILTHLKSSEDKIGHTATNRAAKMRKRVTGMVAALVICFTTCWLPHHLFTLAKIKGVDLSVPTCYGVEQVLVAFAFSNSAINPILYTFMGNNFKERLKRSYNNTTQRFRKNSRTGSFPIRHSSTENQRRGSRYHRGSNASAANDGYYMRKLSQFALLGRRSSDTRRSANHIVKDHEAPPGYYATTTIGEQTVETKI